MSDRPKRPHRAFEITLDVGADTWDDAVAELLRMARHIKEHGPECNSCGGGPNSGHTVSIRRDPEMTHEKYFDAIHAFLMMTNEVKP